VKLGLEQSGSVQILSGVNAGEKVVTDGSFILKSEMLKGQLGQE
jgi:multidrug efflux pump subunit AcrA (membrane-fusion protein)